jgi:hypothetical protein
MAKTATNRGKLSLSCGDNRAGRFIRNIAEVTEEFLACFFTETVAVTVFFCDPVVFQSSLWE